VFKIQGFEVVKGAFDPNICNFIYKYLVLKRGAAKQVLKEGNIIDGGPSWGVLSDPAVIGAWACYADPVAETLLQELLETVSKITETSIVPLCAYARVYVEGTELIAHTDRKECGLSTTINIGGDIWPIFIRGYDGVDYEARLYPGDMLVFKGTDLVHWRNPLEEGECAQIFLHYSDDPSEIYEGRKVLGMPYVNTDVFN
jgi:hypothetical protein